jgi:hypothetical protein
MRENMVERGSVDSETVEPVGVWGVEERKGGWFSSALIA